MQYQTKKKKNLDEKIYKALFALTRNKQKNITNNFTNITRMQNLTPPHCCFFEYFSKC